VIDNKELRQKERAYKIWEDEGRIDGAHLDHWKGAEEQHEQTEEDALGEVAENDRQEADDQPTASEPKQLYGTLVPPIKSKK
jgi:hypothetical protein